MLQFLWPLMGSVAQLVVFLLWSLVEVHSQTAPYISFMGECSDEDEGSVTISGSSTSYTITSLEENSSYFVILRTVDTVGNVQSNATTATTLDACKIQQDYYINIILLFDNLFVSSSICCSDSCQCIGGLFLQYHCPLGGSGLYPYQWRINTLLSMLHDCRV